MIIKIAQVIDDYTVVLNKGRADDIAQGQRVLIYAIGPEITDPDTGESLGQLEVVKGTGRVTHLQQKISTVGSDMTAPAGRTVTRLDSGPFATMRRAMGEAMATEQDLPPKKVPFNDVLVGDLVKLI